MASNMVILFNSLADGPQVLKKDLIVYKEFNVIKGDGFSPVQSFNWGKLKPGKRLVPPKYVHRSNSGAGVFAWTRHIRFFHFSDDEKGQLWKARVRKGTRVVISSYSGNYAFKIRAEKMTLVARVRLKRTS